MNVKPLDSIFITSPYGLRTHPITKRQEFHSGVDLRAPLRTPLKAIADGRVVLSRANNGGPTVGYGWYIVIQHEGFCSLYAHLHELGLPVGTNVKAGQVVGLSGNSGASTAPHLHFEIRRGSFDSKFYERAANGMYYNAVDPTTFSIDPAWVAILKGRMDSPDVWIELIEKLRAEGERTKTIARFFPEFIEKLGRR